MEETWKTIEGFDNYEFSSQNRLKNKTTGKFLTLNEYSFRLYNKDGKIITIALSTLKHQYFPEPIEYLEGEIFLIINDYPNYEISNKGRVYSKYKKDFLAPALNKNGYYFVSLWKHNKQKPTTIHRLLAIYFIPNPDNLPCVDHINRIRTDNRLENLRWVSHSENQINKRVKSQYPHHISKYKLRNYEYWTISINRPGCKFQKSYNCKKYSLEDVVKELNKIYEEQGISILD